MYKEGPGKFGGSRATVRKRAQRKRAVAGERPVIKQEVKATKAVEGVQEKQMKQLAYEVLGAATQLRKAANAFSGSFDSTHAVVEDADRAMKTLYGMLKDNKAKENYKKEN